MPTYGNQYGDGRVSVYDPAINPTAVTNLWKNCPLWEYVHDPSIGVLLDEKFTEYDASTGGEWTLTQSVSGSAAIATTVPGRLSIDAGATTDNQGANLQRLKSTFIPAANKSLWFETKVTLTATTPPVTKAQLFIGMAASDTSIIASGAQSTNNRIGWQILDGALLVSSFTADKAGTGTTATGHTFVAATAVRLGFFYDGVADTLQQYINGVATGTAIATANIPKLAIFPSLVVQSDGTDQPILHVDGMRVFQLR